jgi:hypothetical protein
LSASVSVCGQKMVVGVEREGKRGRRERQSVCEREIEVWWQ